VKARSVAGVQPAAEQSLISRAKQGEHRAFEDLLVPSVGPACRLAFAMLGDTAQAEDAFQEAALRAWRRLGNLREDGPFRPWFMGIVANQCREIRRDPWWRIVRLPDLLASRPMDEGAWLDGDELRRAVRDLPFRERAAVLLHFHLDMPLNEVAIALGISVAGVKTRINRALKRLRPAMGASEVKVNG